jgi:chemotaxis protein MotB
MAKLKKVSVWLGAVLLLIVSALAVLWYRFYRPQEQELATLRVQALQHQTDAITCRSQMRALNGQLADLQTVRAELQKASFDLQQKVQEKESELASLRGTQDELVSGLKKEIESNQIQVERYRDQLRVDLVDEVLFDSGEGDVKVAGRTILDKVGQALKKAEGRRIEVQGHTDNVPIVGALAKRYPTNWELSATRAVNVARLLQQAGVAPDRLSATAHSEYEPRAPNDSDAGRHKNRRIEILLGPKVAPAAPAAAPVPPAPGA